MSAYNKQKWIGKMAAACLTAIAIGAALTGCGSQKFDAKAYAQGALDAMVKGEISDGYASLTEGGKKTAQENHHNLILNLSRVSAMNISEELKERYKKVYEDFLKAGKYTVGEVTENGDGSYTVSVEVEPLQFDFNALEGERTEYLGMWAKEHMDNLNPAAMGEAAVEYECDKMQEFIDAPVYGDPRTGELKIEKKDKYYAITDDSLLTVWGLLFAE